MQLLVQEVGKPECTITGTGLCTYTNERGGKNEESHYTVTDMC